MKRNVQIDVDVATLDLHAYISPTLIMSIITMVELTQSRPDDAYMWK